jgi:membrane fusion protein (multidrug efflux system)
MRPGFAAIVFSLAAALLPVLTACERDGIAAPPFTPPPRPVEILQVTASDIPVQFEFVGRTESSQRVEIRSRVAGYLDEIAYGEGEFVEADQVLFRIDPAPFESRLRAAEAELAQHQARLENALALLTRIEPLAEMEAVAAKELDDARGRVREATAAVEGAASRVFDAELNLGYTTITAPVRGLTGAASQREGAYISGTTGPLTYVARVNPIWVEFSVTETQLLRSVRSEESGAIRYPDRSEFGVVIELADGTRHPEIGRISFADASVNTRTGTVLVRAEIPNPRETLRPGQYVRLFLRGAVRPGAIAVPQRAVREGPRGPYIWVVNADGKAEQRPVALGPWYGDDWIIEGGLKPGDRVVVNGTVGLHPGAPLMITRILDGSGSPRAVNPGHAP